MLSDKNLRKMEKKPLIKMKTNREYATSTKLDPYCRENNKVDIRDLDFNDEDELEEEN